MAAAQTNRTAKDFILFDEPGPFTVAPPAPAVSSAEWSLITQPMGWSASHSQATGPVGSGAHTGIMPTSVPAQVGVYAPMPTSSNAPLLATRPGMESNSSFTQYRNNPGPSESPFSSPATRPEDDFSSSPANSTLDPRSGLPNKKRARGHAHSSSWGGPNSGPVGVGSGEYGARPSANRFSHPAVPDLGVQPSPETFGQLGFPFGGEGDASGEGFGSGLQGLSLGDHGGSMGFSSLFPEVTEQSTSNNPGHGATSEQQRQAHALLAMSMAATSSSSSAAPLAPVNGVGQPSEMYGQSITYTPTEPMDGVTPTPANYARQRQFLQSREDLSGVDPRALRGPLRSARQSQQGAPSEPSSLDNHWQYSGAQPAMFDPRALNIGHPTRPEPPARQRSGSLDSKMATQHSDWSNDPASQSMPPPAHGPASWNNLSNQLQHMFAPGSVPQSQSMTRAHSSQSPSAQRKISKQKRASIDRQNPASGARPPMVRDRSGLTVSPQETLLDYQPPHGATYSLFNVGVPGLAESIAAANAARLRESSSSSSPSEGGPATPQASSFSRRNPLDRNNTARPGLQQFAHPEDRRRSSTASETLSNDDASQSSGSGPSLFSPSAAHFGTSSSLDEDATYHPRRMPSKRSDRNLQLSAHGAGPRFGDVSSSSSESESDAAGSLRGRGLPGTAATAMSGQRMHGMTGYGQMAGSSESGMSIQPSVLAVTRNGNGHITGHQGQGWRSRSASTSQSQDDDGSISPSIRSSAQAIPPPHGFPGANAAGITKCDYVSHITAELCGTEFHRPYDLARHRETIHGKEEAALLRQGNITKEQCRVLYKEVDPAKSLATVEWRCDGRNGCGSVFSRKDALLRHRRIRGHLK
ncbi:Zinc finger, C2H2 [Ceraceosorus bombacis]|uniref:Zinc finger, C2H2 n=1 Tax=Ceraceosorus bombacis TaxID=401625 RepID=A0A0P1BDN6_9BASI|nr:Zinc finger, C2H2 [Ceraceosorus bombacis]